MNLMQDNKAVSIQHSEKIRGKRFLLNAEFRGSKLRLYTMNDEH